MTDKMSLDELEREVEELGDAIDAFAERLSSMEARVDRLLTRAHLMKKEPEDGRR
jgi:cytochrome c peroxidase